MKVVKKAILSILLCFTFIFSLTGCSSINKGYADVINTAYKNGNAITYVEAKRSLGDECIDKTREESSKRSGLLVAIKGVTNEDAIKNATDEAKFDFIVITVVNDDCTYAYFATGSAAEVKSALNNSK